MGASNDSVGIDAPKMLTDTAIRKLKPASKITRHFDALGLYLELTPASGKYWRLKYRFDGKEKKLALGVYACFTLGALLVASPALHSGHTPYNHFALLAESWLSGRLDLGGAPPAYAGNNDFAELDGRYYGGPTANKFVFAVSLSSSLKKLGVIH